MQLLNALLSQLQVKYLPLKINNNNNLFLFLKEEDHGMMGIDLLYMLHPFECWNMILRGASNVVQFSL